MRARTLSTEALAVVQRAGGVVSKRARTEVDRFASRHDRADLALFHDFLPPPTGGGSQFLRALTVELGRRGFDIELNRISGRTPACLYNSFNFDFGRLRRFAREGCRMVHRVDGPIGVYRGFDDGTDLRIREINRDLAEATVLQSRFSLEKHLELGLELREPVVIPNAVDHTIFHPPGGSEPLDARRVRLVATSWSDNPNKGAAVFSWLDRNLDWERYELTFVGRSPVAFEHVRVVGPLKSEEVAKVLREGDIYIAASCNDPCSNALLEALACGLPAAYRDSGGHPELVGDGGLPFTDAEELPDVLDRLVAELGERRSTIVVPPLAEVADRYIETLGLAKEAQN